MRGSTERQVEALFRCSGINQIGESKAEAMESARQELMEAGMPADSSAVASEVGIFSLGTAETYMEKWAELATAVKEAEGIRDIEQITAQHVQTFLENKIELGVSYSHFQGYAAAFGKLESALNSYSEKFDKGNGYNFKGEINSLRDEARNELPRFEGTRNYDDPSRLVGSITNDEHRLVASIQHESGMRVAEASSIQASQLRGLSTDALTGKEVGQIDFIGKGGRENVANVSPETYRELERHIADNGSLNVGADPYRESLKSASEATNQEYNGSHGLRWNYAQERFSELQSRGYSYEKCLGQVSSEMGHNRIAITEHYLAR